MNPRSFRSLSFFTPCSLLTVVLAMAAAAAGFVSSPASAQRSGGGYQVEFRNDSARSANLLHWDQARSRWDSHGSVDHHSTSYQTSNAGDHWAFVDPRTNKVLNSLTVGRFSRQLAISDKHFGGEPGGQAGGRDDHDHGKGQREAVMVELHAINHSSQALYLYRDGGSGSFVYEATLKPGQEREEITPIETTWAMVVPEGSRVVSKLKASAPHNEFEIHDRDLTPSQPPAPAKPKGQAVTVTFVNLASESLDIYHADPGGRGGRGGHTVGTLKPRHQHRMNGNVGDQYHVLRSADRVLVETFSIPDRNTTITISQQQVRGGHDDHAHAGGGKGHGDHGHDHDDHAHAGGGGGKGHDGHDHDHDDHAHAGGHDDHDHDHNGHADHAGGKGHGSGKGPGGGGNVRVIDLRDLLRNIFGR